MTSNQARVIADDFRALSRDWLRAGDFAQLTTVRAECERKAIEAQVEAAKHQRLAERLELQERQKV